MKRVIGSLVFGLILGVAATAAAQTEVFFTQPVDRRFAWLGNDARGEEDFVAHAVALINSATVSVDASTMSFSSAAIGDALAAKANAGVPVRIVMNRGHRFQPGIMAALKGPVQVIDNNFPALYARVSFQRPGSTAPAGWLADSGQVFAAHAGAPSYGWTTDVTTSMAATPDASYTSPLLGHCIARRRSDGPAVWEIEVPNGSYYVHAVVGQPTFNPQNYLTVEGQTVLQSSGGFVDHFATSSGFRSCLVEGDGSSRAINVSDGRLTIQVGRAAAAGAPTEFSSLCYVEIYKRDAGASDNQWTTPDHVQQNGLTHSKFLIIDGSKVWISSANLTDGAAGRSEDAIETTEPAIIGAFGSEFQVQWGASAGTPDPVVSRFMRFKGGPGVTNATIASPVLGASFGWEAFFSPSRTTPGVNVADRIATLINGSQRNIILCLEQFTQSADRYGFHTSGALMSTLSARIAANLPVWGIFGNANAADPVFGLATGHPNAFVSQQVAVDDGIGLHDKFMLTDAFGDSRYARRGKLFAASTNWSQAAIVHNDEQNLVVNDPAIANKYLQRAMKALADEGFAPDRRADIVLVLDRSGSMNDPSGTPGVSKLEASKVAADAFLGIIEPDAGHRVALVRFGSDVEPFTPTDSELADYLAGSKPGLMAQINGTLANGVLANSTCYGRALQRTHDIFQHAGTLRNRRVVHFFTDGLENAAPMATGIYQTLVNDYGAEIHATAFGPFSPFAPGGTAAILGTMAAASGGSFAQLDDLSTMALQKRFIEVARDATDLDTLLDPEFSLAPGGTATTSVMVDSSAGLVEFVAFWGRRAPGLAQLKITTPWGVVLTAATPGVRVVASDGSVAWHVDMNRLRGTLGVETSGQYKVSIVRDREGLKSRAVAIGFEVLADTAIDLKTEVVAGAIGARHGYLLARVLVNGQPARGAKVTATWTLPAFGRAGGTRTIDLYDDGRNGDGAANDGLYGRELKLEPGQHDFHVVAEGKLDKARFGISKFRREADATFSADLARPFEGELPKEPSARPDR